MKKRIAWLCAVGMTVCTIAGCGKAAEQAATPASEAEVVTEASESKPAAQESEAVEVVSEAVEEVEETEEVVEEAAQTDATADYPTLPLPYYQYTGDDKYIRATTLFLLQEFGDNYEQQDVSMVIPMVVKEDTADPADVKVYGSFWINNYKLFNTTLLNMSGGEYTGVIHIDETGDEPVVVDFDQVGDGNDYQPDIEKYFGVEEGLIDKLTEAMNSFETYRAEIMSNYVNSNGINIKQYQDFGYSPIAILNAPPATDEEQHVHYVSPMGYNIDYRLDQMCYSSLGENDEMFSGVQGVCDDALVTIKKLTGTTIDDIKKEILEQIDGEEYTESEGDMFGAMELKSTTISTTPKNSGDTVYQFTMTQLDDGTIFVFCGQNTFTDDDSATLSSDIIGEMFNSLTIG